MTKMHYIFASLLGATAIALATAGAANVVTNQGRTVGSNNISRSSGRTG